MSAKLSWGLVDASIVRIYVTLTGPLAKTRNFILKTTLNPTK
jgi:hypothetical protein